MSGALAHTARGLGQWRWTFAAGVGVLALIAQFVRIGSDWDWLVALGDHLRASGQVPDGVPFAAADTRGWTNVPVLAEFSASVIHGLGPRAPVVLHLILLAIALGVVAATARRRGADDGWTAVALAIWGVGALLGLGVVRAQTYSLVPFALLLALITSQARRADRRVWWAVPLVAVWANLHGAALLGVCFLGAYLLLDRLRHRFVETVLVGVASLLALCATPAGWRTPVYYAGVFANVSAQRGEGLWARPSLTMPFDVVMLVGIVVLGVVFLRGVFTHGGRRPLWEYVACLGLAVAVASASRHGVWLLLVLAVLAPPGGLDRRETSELRPAVGGVVLAVLALVVALPIALVRGEAVLGARSGDVAAIAARAGSGVALAPSPLAESLAVAGVRVWVSNPLDAFDPADQAAYLDFLASAETGDLDGTAARALAAADLVVLPVHARLAEALTGSSEGRAAFTAYDCGPRWVCLARQS